MPLALEKHFATTGRDREVLRAPAMIRFNCKHCGEKLRVSSMHARKWVPCKNCEQAVRAIPGKATSSRKFRGARGFAGKAIRPFAAFLLPFDAAAFIALGWMLSPLLIH